MIDDLMEVDMKPLMDHLQHINKKNKNCFGNLPLMANCSKYQPGGLNAQSFAESINSAANVIVTKDRLKMDPKLIDALVTLRMNSTFMKFICENKYHGSINIIIAGLANQINENDELWS